MNFQLIQENKTKPNKTQRSSRIPCLVQSVPASLLAKNPHAPLKK
jgi:hypothetical protein